MDQTRLDPSGLSLLRRQFGLEIQRRFKAVEKAVASAEWLKANYSDSELTDNKGTLVGVEKEWLKRKHAEAPPDPGSLWKHSDQIQSPEFKKWFGDSKVVNPDGTPRVVYHGTKGDFPAFDMGAHETFMLDRMLGSHFAESNAIAGKFSEETYSAAHEPVEGGNVLPLYLSIKKPLVVPQYEEPRNGWTYVDTDQSAINKAVVNEIFADGDNKDLFVNWCALSQAVSKMEAEKIYAKLQSPIDRVLLAEKEYGDDVLIEKCKLDLPFNRGEYKGMNPVAVFVANYDSGFIQLNDLSRRHVVDLFKAKMKAKGYDGLRYENTSPMETEGLERKDRICWVPFEAGQVKSAIGNRGTFDRNDPLIIHKGTAEGVRKEWLVRKHAEEKPGSLGEHSDQIKSPEFKAWFGNSKVVDEKGEPLVVYHGTRAVFDQFAGVKKHWGAIDPDTPAFWFTDDPEVANYYAHVGAGDEVGSILPIYVSMKNPKIYDSPQSKEFRDEFEKGDGLKTLMTRGYDGVLFRLPGEVGFESAFIGKRVGGFAIKPTQIKSAIGNRGTFDRNDPIITHAEPTINAPFIFETDDRKLRAFNKWFTDQINRHILSVERQRGEPRGLHPWMYKFVTSAYQRGLANSWVQAHPGSSIISVGPVGPANVPPKFAPADLASAARSGALGQFMETSLNGPGRVSKLRLLHTRAFENLKGITSAMAAQMNRIMADSIVGGWSYKKTAGIMATTVAGMTQKRAMLIVDTESAFARAEGQLDGFEELGIDRIGIEAEFVTRGDYKVCPVCRTLEGKEFTVDEARGVIPVHPRCVLPGTIVSARGLIAAIRSTYRGYVLTIRMASGDRISVTENHQFLTPDGFVAAKSLCLGDNVIRRSLENTEGVPNDNDRPTRVDKIFDALAKTRPMFTASVPVTAEDLHGDGRFCDGNVDVVSTNRLERYAVEVSAKQFSQLPLCSVWNSDAFDRLCDFDSMLVGLSLAAHGVVSGSCETPSLVVAGLGHASEHPLAAVSGGESIFEHQASQNTPADAEAIRGLLERFSGLVTVDKVIGIDGMSYRGHVFDLQTESGLYIGNNLLSSNCRCQWTLSEIRIPAYTIGPDGEPVLLPKSAAKQGLYGLQPRGKAGRSIPKAVGRGKQALPAPQLVSAKATQPSIRGSLWPKKKKKIAVRVGTRVAIPAKPTKPTKPTKLFAPMTEKDVVRRRGVDRIEEYNE